MLAHASAISSTSANAVDHTQRTPPRSSARHQWCTCIETQHAWTSLALHTALRCLSSCVVSMLGLCAFPCRRHDTLRRGWLDCIKFEFLLSFSTPLFSSSRTLFPLLLSPSTPLSFAFKSPPSLRFASPPPSATAAPSTPSAAAAADPVSSVLAPPRWASLGLPEPN
jgi:hypothetical protein